jgi:hypothetical protein
MIQLDLHPALCLVQTDNIRDFYKGLVWEWYMCAMLPFYLIIDD